MLKKFRNAPLVGYIVLVLGIGGVYTIGQHDQAASRANIVNSGRVVAVEGCNRDFKSTQNVRALLDRIIETQDRNYAKGLLTKQQYKAQVEFYTGLKNTVVLPDCRHADDTLTDSPDAKIKVPPALHPAD